MGILDTPLSERKTCKVTDAFVKALIELAEGNGNIIVLDADLQRCSGTAPFRDRFPNRHFHMGVAEQNMMSVASGLALSGLVPFINSFSCFVIKRACDQLDISVGLNKTNVKICGDYAGITTEQNGPTHGALGDIAIARTIPGLVIVSPADTIELYKMVKAIAAHHGPVYLRKPKGPLQQIFSEDYEFEIGKAMELTPGNDAVVISCGIMTWQALLASEKLKEEKINVKVINMSTINPVDEETIVKAAFEAGLVITVENHSVRGGLGETIAGILAQKCPTKMKMIGIADKYICSASLEWQLDHFGLSAEYIAKAVKDALKE